MRSRRAVVGFSNHIICLGFEPIPVSENFDRELRVLGDKHAEPTLLRALAMTKARAAVAAPRAVGERGTASPSRRRLWRGLTPQPPPLVGKEFSRAVGGSHPHAKNSFPCLDCVTFKHQPRQTSSAHRGPNMG